MQKWRVTWDRRGQKYYAYLRKSQKINGKVKTQNIYLGADLVSAGKKLQQYLKDNGIPADKYLAQLQQLGMEKGVPHQIHQPIDQQFETIRALVSRIADGDLKQEIDKAIVELWAMVSPKTAADVFDFLTPQEPETKVASAERILALYRANETMPRGKYQYICDVLNRQREYDETGKPWTAENIKKSIQKLKIKNL